MRKCWKRGAVFVLLRAPSISRNISRSTPRGDNYIKVNSTLNRMFQFFQNISLLLLQSPENCPAVVSKLLSLKGSEVEPRCCSALRGTIFFTDVKKI